VALDTFHPRVREWFERRYGAPTEIQALAWPGIAAGEHLLVCAPTGSGKTLTGFLWPLDRLLTGAWPGGALRVLYVSPLKALNADIERNLRQPLAEISAVLAGAGLEPEPVRVAVRSGDTPAAERARMQRKPPEILITTPESLNLLLLAKAAPTFFRGVRLVILDEIHAVAGNKRGTHLVTAVERLTRIAGEFQRVAISATVRPLERVARFVGGRRMERAGGGGSRFVDRQVRIVESRADKRYELSVRAPAVANETEAAAAEARPADEFWRRLAEDLRQRIGECRSTLVFTNSRRTAEKVTRFLNESAGRELAWSHHGSLSREIRTAVEARLKEGKLPSLVATSSLELGIDVGALDRVLLLQTPRSLASAAQRIGRSGHCAGETSRAIFYPTHPRDFLDAAVAVRSVLDGDIEPVRPVELPLDLLAQTLLALVAREPWKVDELYDFVRTADPYRDLGREPFDLVIEMLTGRYQEARIEELKPRLAFDRLDGTLTARPGIATLLARAGGTIPDRGYFQLRLHESGAKLGELDEEFVWERSVGDSFTLGAQGWRIRAITSNEVFVAPARGGAALAPFWRADAQDRGSYFSERIGRFLERADADLDDPRLARRLGAESRFEPEAVEAILALLREQREALGVALPHRHHLVIEESAERAGDAGKRQVVIYTFWGGSLNRPLALALAALWQEREGSRLEVLVDDDALLLVMPSGADAAELLRALDPGRVEELLRQGLEASGYFGAHFRQNAQRALLLPRASPRRRTPLWVSRQNAKKLLDTVADFDDFPLVLETWRTCLRDEFELDVLRARLDELARGEIRLSSVRGERPSPFAAGLMWQRTNQQMYEDDAPESGRASRLRGDLLREVALAAQGRPAIPPELCERFRAKAQRLLPGYPPATAIELLEWVKERLWISDREWNELEAAIDLDRRVSSGDPCASELVEALAGRIRREEVGQAAGWIATEDVARWSRARQAPTLSEAPGDDPLAPMLEQWLRFQPPRTLDDIVATLGLEIDRASAAVDDLVRRERAVRGRLVAGDDRDRIAALSAFETLLRWKRAAARGELRALPLEMLPLFVAEHQGALSRGSGVEGVQATLERLFGASAPAALWEHEVLPTRIDSYATGLLDSAMGESELVWLGSGRERIAFAFRTDLDLLADEADGSAGVPESAASDQEAELRERVRALLRESPRGADLATLAEGSGSTSGDVSRALWDLAWRGEVACDSMRALRQGILARFSPVETPPESSPRRRSGRGSFRRWQSGRPFDGRWHLRPSETPDDDPLAREERNRDRIRLLLDRWGVVSRELLALERPGFGWARLARSLRALELSGEVVGGHFFDGVPGLQFAAPAAVENLRQGLESSAVWWLNAADPTSLAGADLSALKATLPRRVPSNVVVWRGHRVALVIERSGRDLDFRVPADDPALTALLEPLEIALTRSFDPERGLEVRCIQGEPAATSPYRSAFERFTVVREGPALRLRRRWQG